MGFYFVDIADLEAEKDPKKEIMNFLFPSSIVKEIFPAEKVFTAAELRKALAQGTDKSLNRLEEVGDIGFAAMSILPVMEQIQKSLSKIIENHRYKVVKSEDMNSFMKSLSSKTESAHG